MPWTQPPAAALREDPDLHALMSRHAAALRRLRFEPALEGAYRADRAADVRTQMRVAGTAALLIWLAYAVADLLRVPGWHGPWTWEHAVLSLDRALVTGVLLAALHRVGGPRCPAHPQPLAMTALLALSVGSVLAMTLYLRLGVPAEPAVLLLLELAVFLPLGLGLRETVAGALMLALMPAVCAWALLPPSMRDPLLRMPWLLGSAAVLGAAGAWQRERSARTQFLLRQRLHWLATRDPLTRMHTRRLFDRALAAPAARRAGLVLVDIDHFKRYNDQHGHPAGDLVLMEVAEVLARAVRHPDDIAARLGGEEFGLLLHDTDALRLEARANELVARVRRLAIPHAASPTGPCVTLSAGAAMRGDGEATGAFFRRVDALLYAAKHGGRDRACCAGTPAPEGPGLG